MTNTINVNSFVLSLKDIDKTKFMVAGGKGANLGELARMDGTHVPDGFCISTDIEWCLADDSFYFVQSRLITIL